MLAANGVREDVWALESHLLAGATRHPGWHTETQPFQGLPAGKSPSHSCHRDTSIVSLAAESEGSLPTSTSTVTAVNSSFAQGLRLPSLQQQLLLPPQLLAQRRASFPVFQPFPQNLEKEMARGVPAAGKQPSPRAQLQHHLLNRERGGNSVCQGCTWVCTLTLRSAEVTQRDR